MRLASYTIGISLAFFLMLVMAHSAPPEKPTTASDLNCAIDLSCYNTLTKALSFDWALLPMREQLRFANLYCDTAMKAAHSCATQPHSDILPLLTVVSACQTSQEGAL